MVGPQPTGPAPGPAEAVRHHAPGLHRSAVMLTGDAVAADRLVVETFRQAPATADRAQLLELLVRILVRHRGPRRRDELDPGAGDVERDAGDVLADLRPRARAATVLRRVERWPASRVAEALGLERTAIARLVPRTPGVEAALEAVAERHARPADEVVATVLTALTPAPAAGGAARPSSPTARLPSGHLPAPVTRVRTEAARLAHRPWTWRVLAAALALGLVVWVTALGDPAGRDRLGSADADAVGRTLALSDGTTLTTAGADLEGRGWTLGPDGEPPEDLEGLRMVEKVRIDLERPNAPLRIDTWPRSGAAVFAVLWCDLPVLDPNLDLPAARLGIGGEAVVLPCAGTRGEPPVERLVPLPPAGGRGRTTALVTWTGDVPGRGQALLATYTEVGAGPPPVEAGSTLEAEAEAAAPPLPQEGSVVLDGATAAYQVLDRPVHHQRVRIGAGSTVTVWVGGVGEITVQVDDVVLTDDGETPGAGPLRAGQPGAGQPGAGQPAEAAPAAARDCESESEHTAPRARPDGGEEAAWRTADPELRDGRWLVYRPGRAREIELPERVRPATGERREATVSVTTTLDRRSWQVHVRDAEPVVEDRAPLPLADVSADRRFPRWVAGHQLVAAWKVPNDGRPHRVVDPGLRPGRRFLLVGSPARTGPSTWGITRPHVATTRGPAELSVVGAVPDAFDEGVWRPGDQLVRAGASTHNIRAGTGTGVVSATAPAAVGETAPSTLLVYQPVPYREFDFGSAPPMGVSLPLDGPASGRLTDPPVGTPDTGTVVAGRWTRADLDDDGRLTIDTDLPGRSWLRFTTAGPGRVQVLEHGRPAVWLPDGWWTSWTAEPVVTVVRVEGPGRAGAPGRPFELLVEGYEERFAVEVLLRDGEDGPPGTT